MSLNQQLVIAKLAFTNIIGSYQIEALSMTINEALRMIAGAIVLISVILAVTVNIQWLWLTAFVGLNLLQSSFTRWCPMIVLLRKLGLKD